MTVIGFGGALQQRSTTFELSEPSRILDQTRKGLRILLASP